MVYNPKLDSLRTLCIISVMLFHWGLIDAGWAGVQYFFVLPGYLITGILLQYRKRLSAKEYFRAFYYRGALRIFPLYFVLALLHEYRAIILTELLVAEPDGVGQAGMSQAVQDRRLQ